MDDLLVMNCFLCIIIISNRKHFKYVDRRIAFQLTNLRKPLGYHDRTDVAIASQLQLLHKTPLSSPPSTGLAASGYPPAPPDSGEADQVDGVRGWEPDQDCTDPQRERTLGV